MGVKNKARLAKEASRQLAVLEPQQINTALVCMAQELEMGRSHILQANLKDLDAVDRVGITGAFRKRLALSEAKVNGMVQALREMAELPCSLGETIETITRPNGLIIKKVRVPFGVIGIIYESRPNVTSDAAGLCIKSGNATVLRGGSEARNSNMAIAGLLRDGLEKAGVSKECVQYIDNPDREEVQTMMNLRGQIDVLIPRGGPGLMASVKNAGIPVIETGVGNCHTYIDAYADLAQALSIAVNAKVSNPAVCNAMETLLVHEQIAKQFLPVAAKALISKGVELRGCPKSVELEKSIIAANDEDWPTEYLDLILAIKVVSSLEEAIEHISVYGTGHSEAIVTQNEEHARKFTQSVDAATVYVNASTRFTDGGEFGFGAEIGISTQKLHARGPMGITELTTHKYVIEGTGQIR